MAVGGSTRLRSRGTRPRGRDRSRQPEAAFADLLKSRAGEMTVSLKIVDLGVPAKGVGMAGLDIIDFDGNHWTQLV